MYGLLQAGKDEPFFRCGYVRLPVREHKVRHQLRKRLHRNRQDLQSALSLWLLLVDSHSCKIIGQLWSNLPIR